MDQQVLDTNQILVQLNRSQSWLTKLVKTGNFPKSFKLTIQGRKNYWLKKEVEEWVDKQIQAVKDVNLKDKSYLLVDRF